MVHTIHVRSVPIFLILIAANLVAGPTKLPSLRVGSTVYSNAVVMLVTATDIYFKHDCGVANVKLKFLEPELQARFGYDPAVAAAVERTLLEREKQFSEAVARQIAANLMRQIRGPDSLGNHSISDPLTSHSLVNKPLPQFEVNKWLTDKPTLTNRLALIFFWTTESLPCRTYIELYNNWQKKFGDDLIIVGICTELPETIIGFTELPVQFALAADPEKKAAQTLGVTEVPHIILVDPKGIVRYKGHPAAITEKTIKTLIEFFSTPSEQPLAE